MLGTYALSAGYYDAYYAKALKVRRLIRQDYLDAFEKVDLIGGPVSATAAFKLGEKWFPLPDETLDLFMTIHEGAWLGPSLKPFYVLLLGLGLLVLAATGLRLTGLFGRRSRH